MWTTGQGVCTTLGDETRSTKRPVTTPVSPLSGRHGSTPRVRSPPFSGSGSVALGFRQSRLCPLRSGTSGPPEGPPLPNPFRHLISSPFVPIRPISRSLCLLDFVSQGPSFTIRYIDQSTRPQSGPSRRTRCHSLDPKEGSRDPSVSSKTRASPSPSKNKTFLGDRRYTSPLPSAPLVPVSDPSSDHPSVLLGPFHPTTSPVDLVPSPKSLPLFYMHLSQRSSPPHKPLIPLRSPYSGVQRKGSLLHPSPRKGLFPWSPSM